MNSEPQNSKKYPEGHFVGQWMAIGIAIFSGLGIPLSIATGNNAFIGVGPAIGIAMGISIGQSIENKYKKEGRIRPLTDKEKQTRRNLVLSGLVLLVLGLVAFVLLYLNK